jgi:hypothetical protein
MIHYFAQDEIAASVEAVLGRPGERRAGADVPPYAVQRAQASHAAEAMAGSPAAY